MNKLSNIISNKYYLFFILFFYTIFLSFFIQNILFPNFFSEWVNSYGLLKNTDSIKYHEWSVLLSNNIRTIGWQEWELLPYTDRHFIVGLISLFYALIVPEPWVMLPINAFIHVLSVYILIKIALLFTDKYYLALLSVTPYMFFPSTLFWCSQLLKDGYYNLGVIMFCYGWMNIAYIKKTYSNFFNILVGPFFILSGYLLMGLIRTFSLSVMFFESLLILFILSIILFFSIYEKKINWLKYSKKIFLSLFCIFMMIQIQHYLIKNDYTSKNKINVTQVQPIDNIFRNADIEKNIWTQTSWLPKKIDQKVSTLVGIRKVIIDANKQNSSGSAIDLDVMFESTVDTLLYIPRALQISFFSPFPSKWFEEGSTKSTTMMRKIVIFEMLLIYISYLSFPLAFIFWIKRTEFWIPLFYCSSMMTLYAIAVPNIGTIFRYRYPYLMILITILIISGHKFIYKKFFTENEKYNS